MKNLIIVLVILGGITFGALNYHFILFDDSLKVLKKADLTLDSTFVDARGAGKLKLLLNPALIEAGFKDLVRQHEDEKKK
ncbi:hypothetical protein DENIS_0855 [Desulfonema ishimotonii]|uniref:Uncharacterized protein n=1 Tax=Desulfonema ishimotonii TaxID=45657 RepID=A0A401FSI4_9BACT|nr:hypothetical protein [Desulfonema ishimotonii]GBC59913.1 hypothetical protein DENIS_0855 [Desulfonema ishimotonii]